MNTLPPNEPLDDQEREFARILRALPGGEPPAALDSAILRAANNAVAASSRRSGARRILASAGALWGIGSAAAAVLALGVAWQLRYGVSDQAAPAGESARAPQAQMARDTEDDPVQVELNTQPADAPFVPPPPPPKEAMDARKPLPAAALRRQASEPARAAAAAAPAAAAAEPEAFSRDHLDEHVSTVGTGAINPVDVQSVESTTVLTAEQIEKISRERAKTAADQGARAEAELEFKGRAAAKAAAQNAAAPPPPPAAPAPASASALGGLAAPAQSRADDAGKAEEAPRKPANWLADIRKLRDQGRIEEARAALVEFHEKYPKWVIPTDLAPLLSE